ncbi:MAG: hypothetical protein AAFY02_13410 [Pseudomonadota bacterium]
MSYSTPGVKLRGTQMAGEAYGSWTRNLAAWATAVALPFAILMAVTYGIWQILISEGVEAYAQQEQAGSGLRDAASTLVQIIIYTLFAVAWHRFLVLQEKPKVIPTIGSQHVRFILWTLGLTLLMAIPAAVVFGLVAMLSGAAQSPLASLLILPAIGLVIYLVARVSVLFPAVACQEPLGLVAAWRMTRGNGLAIVLAVVLASIPIILIAMLLSVLLFGNLAQVAQSGTVVSEEQLTEAFLSIYWMGSLVGAVISFIGSTVAVGIASSAYRQLR